MIRRDCTAWLEKVGVQIPSIVLGARDADGHDVLDAIVTVDGQPLDRARGGPIELNPGPHVIRWESAGQPPVEMRVALRPQEKSRQVIATIGSSASGAATIANSAATSTRELAPTGAEKTTDATPRPGLPVATYVFGGVGVVALGAFAYFGLRARRDSNALHDGCAPACAHDDVTALKTKLVLADVALGVGALSLGAATFFALRGESAPRKATWDLRVAPTVGGARAKVEIRF